MGKKKRTWEWCPEVKHQPPSGVGQFAMWDAPRPDDPPPKRVRKRCPTCNRLLTMRIHFHDGEPIYCMPMHKRRI